MKSDLLSRAISDLFESSSSAGLMEKFVVKKGSRDPTPKSRKDDAIGNSPRSIMLFAVALMKQFPLKWVSRVLVVRLNPFGSHDFALIARHRTGSSQS